MTPQERELWVHLRNRKLGGIKFRTQNGVGYYIADFFSFDCMLAIELDGHQHETIIGQGNDSVRDQSAESLGITVLRFTNEQVESDLAGVVNKIREVAASLPKRNPRRHSIP